MISYWIGGEGYTQILVDVFKKGRCPKTEQYYVFNGEIVKRSTVKFHIDYAEDIILKHIETTDTDTVILPKGIFYVMDSYAVKGGRFERIVIPLNMQITLRDKALYGNEYLKEYKSLSRKVVYEGNVFPITLERKYF